MNRLGERVILASATLVGLHVVALAAATGLLLGVSPKPLALALLRSLTAALGSDGERAEQ